jgi:CheY-like chemotaxis protein
MAKSLKNLESQYNTIKGWLKPNILEPDIFNFLQVVGKAKSEKYMREALGHGGRFQDNIKLQIYDLLRAIVSRANKDEKFEVLWIENNARPLLEIDNRFKEVLKNKSLNLKDALINAFSLIDNSSIYLYEKDFQNLYNYLLEAKQKKEKKISINCKLIKGDVNVSISLNDISMILVDISLEEEGRKVEVDGVDFVNVLREVCPHIPVFILSIIGDYNTIQKAFSKGADFYVTKNQVFSVPFLYEAYIIEMGELIHFIKNKELQRSLLGNIRYWKYKKNYLWFGDKCYHMIDHSFSHISDDWEIANKILVPLLRTGFLSDEYQLNKEAKITKDELLYTFCMAIWLHDIGHKGTHRYGEPHLIRDTHGIISGEIILSLPESFGIKNGSNSDHIYKDLLFPVGEEEKPVTQLILEETRRNKTLSIPEMIALFSIYHKSNCPLREKEYYEMVRNGKFIPSDFFEDSKPGRPVIPLEKILDEVGDGKFKQDFLALVALFRLIDGLNIRVSRVGDPNEEDMKKWVIKRDLEYNFKRMKDLTERMSTRFSGMPLQQASFVKSFLLDVKEKIERKESISINELAKQLSSFKEWEEYRMLLSYCYFIGAQEGHFDLHSSVSGIEIEYEGGRCFKITLFTEKDEKKLKEMKVYEVGKSTESVYDRLIGEDCYILRGLRTGKKDLEKILDQVTIQLKNLQTGMRYGKPRIWQKGRK